MRRLTYAEFLEERNRFDVAVARTPEISSFCSGSLWQCAAFATLETPGEEDEVFVVEEDGQWLVFAERGQSRVFSPLEAAWMFGCPLVGDATKCVDLLLRATREFLRGPVGFLIGGVRFGGRLHGKLECAKREFVRYAEFSGTDCMVIDLAGGVEEWLARRSRRFRKNVVPRQIPEGLEIVAADFEPVQDILRRILAIQRRTYKWEEGSDIFQVPGYGKFYEALVSDLRSRGALRALFARFRGAEVAYILGGVQGSTYRGLQMSYVESARPLALGNLLQFENLQARAAEGIHRYNLGMHAPYKERWADRRERYAGIFVVR